MTTADTAGDSPITVELGERSYLVHVGRGLIGRVGALIRERLPAARKCAVVTSKAILGIHGNALMEALGGASIEATSVLVPDGEEAKTWSCAERLIGELLENRLARKSAVVAFGGGAVGDLSGFVSAIFLRGVSLVQVPTTLLAQVDSSLGGKAAVNHPMGKNLVGAFHQPSLVVSDPELLITLPRREVLSGMAEVVKHGVIADSELFDYIEKRSGELVDTDPDALSHVVRRSVAIKARLVSLDERDSKGVRVILNYGHTAGHALETLTGHELRHGEAVAMGMEIAARISAELGLIEEVDVGRQIRLLERLGLGMTPPKVGVEDMMDAMRRDKKTERGSIRFVLPTGIGTPPVFRAVQDELISSVLEGEGYG
ncbi:MAG: 3-dehydroquinate synthase [Candidatus Bathyarchaeota archaeon]|nr:MAG: 3-dehydroquinate synthase [Candidatus Bathyarchaeota archaeon]